jgi:hypothetical protein
MAFPSPSNRSGLSGIPIAVFMLLLAAFFLWGPEYKDIPASPASMVNIAFLTTEPRREALGDPPILHLNGFDRNCMDCHKLFPPRLDTPTKLLMHDHIVLNHGINDQCRNCHDLKDRDRLVLRDNTTIPYSESVKLCAKCHGPTYRDWEMGMHGRSNGYWNQDMGPLKRLDCVECHDPHWPTIPAMLPMRPMPGPHTLRMGDPSAGHDVSEDDPLRKAILRKTEK